MSTTVKNSAATPVVAKASRHRAPRVDSGAGLGQRRITAQRQAMLLNQVAQMAADNGGCLSLQSLAAEVAGDLADALALFGLHARATQARLIEVGMGAGRISGPQWREVAQRSEAVAAALMPDAVEAAGAGEP